MKRKKIIITTISIILALLILIGATYAYLMAQGGKTVSTETEVITDSADSLVFTVDNDDALKIEADDSNFLQNGATLSGTAQASAILKPNSKYNKAYAKYDLMLEINYNDFEYTINNYPDLLLRIYQINDDNSKTEYRDVKGLDYFGSFIDKDNKYVQGFDITTKKGVFTLVDDFEIYSSTGEISQTWEVEVTFVNKSGNQNANIGKSFSANLIIGRRDLSTICNINDKLSDCISKYYTELGTSMTYIYYHDGSLENGLNDLSYRFAGPFEKVNNYVCFNYDDSTKIYYRGWCSNSNLYRIIGSFYNSNTGFYEVKLMKYQNLSTSYSNLDNSSEYPNNYLSSPMNNYLNGNYYESLQNNFKGMLADHVWSIGGNTADNILNVQPSIAYENEVLHPSNEVTPTMTAKIAYPYVTDILYSYTKSYWGRTANYFPTSYDSYSDYSFLRPIATFTRVSNTENKTERFYGSKVFTTSSDNVAYSFPTFYLKNSVRYNGGTGTFKDPIRLIYN